MEVPAIYVGISIYLPRKLDTVPNPGSQNWDLEAELWSKLKRSKIIARKLFSLGSSEPQNWDLEAELWRKLKQSKIIARKLFSVELKV